MLGLGYCSSLDLELMELINEELGRHRGRDGRKRCLLCRNEHEGDDHVL